jgi:gamma-glutamyltranspeptidase / glutathione hydrolase
MAVLTGEPAALHESSEITQFSVIDASDNAVRITYTLNGLWGSGVTVAKTGVLLNNEMDDFAVKIGSANACGLLQSDNLMRDDQNQSNFGYPSSAATLSRRSTSE